ncbi:MAG: bifunctional diguanylate cyclase/phosphodiesterase [Pelolinea sp.]|jgi:diguanylate cyclase (GGDEF)-like protein|nr:bifunctional diguanylate cyclase/phosphodiesterase [Pelolinea sp.]
MNAAKKDYKISTFLLISLIFGTIINLLILTFSHSDKKIFASDIGFILLNALSVFSLWLAIRCTRGISAKMTKAWIFVLVAQASFVMGDVLWFIFEGILHIEPYPSAADFFYVLYYPLLFLGISLFPVEKAGRFDNIKRWLDSLLVLISGGLILWITLLVPVSGTLQEETFLIKLLTLFYPAADLVLFSAIVVLLYKYPKGKMQQIFLLLIGSIFFQIVSDLLFSFQSLKGTYISGGWVDSGWVVAYFLLGIAGIVQANAKPQEWISQSKISPRKAYHSRLLEWIQGTLPYLFITFAYTTLVLIQSRVVSGNVFYLVLIVGIIILLSLIRQHLVIVENKKLNAERQIALKELEKKSFDLQTTNEDLRHEIFERKKIEEQLSFDSLHDALTRLPNRILITDRLNHAIDISKRNKEFSFSVLFLDLDQFKSVNDSLGHSVGDDLLVLFAERIKKCIRKSDTFARLGGDEFAILLEDHRAKEKAVEVADRIQKALHEPYSLSGQSFFVTASIGIVNEISENYDAADAILRDADIAMYRAKELGKARYQIFNTSLRTEMLSRITLEAQMRSAVENDEFTLHYQPIYSLDDSELTGFEALIRWNHPQLGLLMPVDFLPIAESTGFILELGDWVLSEACEQMKEWQERLPFYKDLSINVNISGKQFAQVDFLEKIRDVLHKTGLRSSNLKLEITETVLIQNQELAMEIFDELQKMDIELQIDDFGTGYSSIGYLQRFPVGTIKIDQSFIRDIEENHKDSQIVQTMIRMANDLGIKIIAEGIETDTQLKVLRSMECGYGQGFYLSYPMAPQKVETLLREKGNQHF